MRALVTLLVVSAAAAVLSAQQPPIQNGRVETRQATSIDREIQTIAKSATEPVWVGWRVPMIDGDRDMCSWYGDQNGMTRGFVAEPRAPGAARPQITPPTGPVPIEAGTALVVLVRLSGGSVERVRTIGGDCPIDAGGRTIYWLNGVSATDSVKYLETLTIDRGENGSSNMLSAIALHRDASADAVLDRAATSDTLSSRRRQAISLLGSHRGAHGFATLRQLLEREPTSDSRRAIVASIGKTSQPETVTVLRSLLRDPDAKLRADAVYWFAQRGRAAAVADVLKVINEDADVNIKKRAIAGLAQVPNEENLPTLIQLARSHPNADVRKEAFSRVSQSQDPRAIALMQEVLKR